ncbi:hypothetical protein OF83DRAFT_1245321 [Amylostereum chailletii]|nr:hypothetical protein OF83DRAFT_1245321 [Amylostereum chailletii]
MNPLSFALLAILTASFSLAAPVGADNATLLANGQDAQRLNAEFVNLTTSSPCTDNQNACIKNDFATCSGGKWQTQACPGSKSCFALPNLRSNGTFVACTSPNNALSILTATGATGGFNVTDSNNTVIPFPTASNSSTSSTTNSTSPTDGGEDDGDDDCDDNDDSSDNGGGDDDDCDDDSANGDSNGTPSHKTVTVTATVTVVAGSASTVGTPIATTITTTIPASAVPSILSSLTASADSVTTIVSAAPSAGVSSLPASSSGGVRAASPTSLPPIALTSILPSSSQAGGVFLTNVPKPSGAA